MVNTTTRSRSKNPNARSENVSARIAAHIQSDLDHYCETSNLSKSMAVSNLIELGLEHIKENRVAVVEVVDFFNVDSTEDLGISVTDKPLVTIPHNDIVKSLIRGMSRQFREVEGQRIYEVFRSKLGALLKILQALDVDPKKIMDLVEILL